MLPGYKAVTHIMMTPSGKARQLCHVLQTPNSTYLQVTFNQEATWEYKHSPYYYIDPCAPLNLIQGNQESAGIYLVKSRYWNLLN
jgi:hypothetical protein